MLDKRPARVLLVTECSMAVEHRGRGAGHRVHPAVQPLPAHEADHAAEDSRQPGAAADEVTVDPLVAERARRAVERMVNLKLTIVVPAKRSASRNPSAAAVDFGTDRDTRAGEAITPAVMGPRFARDDKVASKLDVSDQVHDFAVPPTT